MSSVKTTTKTTEGPSSTVKTTTYESRSSYDSDEPKRYRSMIGPRSHIIHRTSYGGPQSTQMTRQQQTNMAYNQSPFSAGAVQAIASTGVVSVKSARATEKKDMQDLNERFASYIEKVRFLEAQNRKLADELDKLKSKWGKETSAIKAMYEAELEEARNLLDDNEKAKAKLELENGTLLDRLAELEDKLETMRIERIESKDLIEKQIAELGEANSEVAVLRKRMAMLETEDEKKRAEIKRLTDLLQKCRIDLDNETLAHIDAENRRQTIQEQMEFMQQVHEQELKELAALAYRDTTNENREFWKSEMGNALREIQAVYDDKMDCMKCEMETNYNVKLQEFRTGATRQNMESTHSKEESKRLKAQVSDLKALLAGLETKNAMLERQLANLQAEFSEKESEWATETGDLKMEVAQLRAEMDAILKELQDLMDTKLGLELEIAAYRKLLEGEENRIGLRRVVSEFLTSSEMTTSSSQEQQEQSQNDAHDDSSLKVSQVVKGEMSAKTTYQRSAKGPITIAECSADGRYIMLENTGRKEENIGQWVINRNLDNNKEINFTLEHGFKMRQGAKCKIWAGSRPASAAANDIVNHANDTWGIGANICTKLVNPAGEDRATHNQKTIYSS